MAPTPAAPSCPECDHGPAARPVLGRRDFLRAVGTSAVALAAGGAVTPKARARSEAARTAEDMVRELVAGLSADQRKKLVLPWDHRTGGAPTRLGMFNAPVGESVIHKEYTKPQAELLARLFRNLSNGDDGYRRLSRGGDFDDSGAFENIGCLVFGDPTDNGKYSLMFAGHHLTLRCDGNSEAGAAFGGPLYYGHSPNGYSDKNVFAYQTRSVRGLFDALDGKQREAAVLTGSPGEQAASVKFRKPPDAPPGLPIGDMTRDQKELVEKVMRDLISPYRKEDGDEVMEVITANGGMGKIRLAFYQDPKPTDKQPWHFWRLEGPGFVWNFRVLPHVHTFVNVSTRVG